MQGIITSIDREEAVGRILTTQGDSLLMKLDDSVKEALPGMQVEFERQGSEAVKVALPDVESFDPLEVPYREVEDFAIYRSSELPFGQELLAKAPHAVKREGRTPDSAKWKMMTLAKKCGANTLINYTEERFIRNSIGFSFYMYRTSAVPAVAASIDPNAFTSRDELMNKLDLEMLKREYQIEQGVESSRLALKIICGVLLLIFFIGFLLSLS